MSWNYQIRKKKGGYGFELDLTLKHGLLFKRIITETIEFDQERIYGLGIKNLQHKIEDLKSQIDFIERSPEKYLANAIL